MTQFQIGRLFYLSAEAMTNLDNIAKTLDCSPLEALDKSIKFTKQVEREIKQIIEKIQSGDSVKLLCWCKPKDCHADVLVRYINWRIESNII